MEIDEFKQQINIDDYISEYVELKRTGLNQVGLCPFHNEKSGSFVVFQSGYHCYGCQSHGDIISFVMEYHSLDFVEAVKHLSDKYRIPIKLTGIKRIVELNHAVANYCYSQKDQIVPYLVNRGLSEDFIDKYGLGYCKSIRDLYKHLSVNYTDKEINVSGVLSITQSGMSSFMGKRLLIPIHNQGNEIIGFSARTLDDNIKPKYINSKDSKWFNKSATLYNIKSKYADKVFVVEGYFDVWAFDMAGYDAVAIMGTALTKDHISTLSKRGCKEIVIAFDNDNAGKQAVLKSLGRLIGCDTTISVMETESDPFDSYADETLDADIESRVPIDEYLKECLRPLSHTDSVNMFTSIWKDIDSEHERNDFVQLMSGYVGISEIVLRQNIKQKYKVHNKVLPDVEGLYILGGIVYNLEIRNQFIDRNVDSWIENVYVRRVWNYLQENRQSDVFDIKKAVRLTNDLFNLLVQCSNREYDVSIFKRIMNKYRLQHCITNSGNLNDKMGFIREMKELKGAAIA